MEEQKFNKNKYDQQYKKDHFDNFSFFTPKGYKDKLKAKAEEKDMTLSEYLRYLIDKDLEKDT